ncbi:thioredoxin family protein [Sphingomonas koreensis]|nr:thioredoxin family protein [Sphingomonas koreensis]
MRLIAAAFLALSLAGVAFAVPSRAPAPRVAAASFDQLAQPLPLPYDESANALKSVAAAKARARAEHKKLLIDLGGNWCLDCRILAGTMDLPQLKPFLDRHYVTVTVDIGGFDKNLAVPQHYGIAKLAGVPAVLIVDPRTDRVVNAGRAEALADARSMNPQALADWLAQWA